MNELVETSTRERAGNLWAITCYFNPIGYKTRLRNYQAFRQRLAVPLLTVELSFDGNFQLRRDDADIVVQLQGRHVMWQKERLLNVALQLVPPACDRIAWLDCDVVFERSDWPERAIRALDQFALLRLFHKRHDLPRDAPVDQLRLPDSSAESMADIADPDAVLEDPLRPAAPLEQRTSPGLAWAGRRDVLAKHGVYDACILGSGDRAILCAALGQFDYIARALRMNRRRLEHYLTWAEPFFESVHGRIGYLQGRIFHLWHGDRNDREYRERQALLEKFEFDPYTDIAVDGNGCWRWNSDKPDLHESVKRYFESRNEDGVRAENASDSLMDVRFHRGMH